MVPLALAILLAPPPTLLFRDLLTNVGGHLEPSGKLRAAVGTRVRFRGYVAELELPPKGGFWLCPAPVEGDESGGGTADLPAESVFVVVRSSPNTVFRPPHRLVEVTGRLEMSPRPLPDGTMTRLRLVLDQALPKPSPNPRPPTHRKTRPSRLLSAKS